MPELGRFARELRARFWKPSVQDEVQSELAYHLELLEQELVARGVPADEARAAARARFGDAARIGAECERLGEHRDRERRRARWLHELAHDVRHAARQLRANPRFTLVAVLTLAVGLGASTTIFGVADAVLLRPLPFPEADRLAVVYEVNPAGQDWAISESDYLDLQAGARHLAAFGAWMDGTPSIAGDGEPEQLRGAAASHTFFQALGVRPARGRVYGAEEDRRGGDRRVAAIGHALWQRRFGGDGGVIGRLVELDGAPHRVIGVMPPGFDFPGRAEVWTPLAAAPDYPRGDRRTIGVARLAPRSTVEQATAELRAIAARLAAEHPASNEGWGARAEPLVRWFVSPQLEARVVALLAAVGLLLVMACVNVASLLLARAGAREREMAVRAALGAGRGRIVRQLLTESLVLSLLGAAAGVALAAAAVPLIRHTGTAAVPQLADLGVDWRVLSFALAACVVTGLVFGLAPALRLARGRASGGGALEVLRGGTRVAHGGRLRSTLIVASVAMATLLLVGAGLVGSSFRKLMDVELGFAPERVLTASLALPGERYDEERSARFQAELEARLQAIPGVVAAGATNIAPFSGGSTGMGWEVGARATGHVGDYRNAAWRAVTPGFFPALGIPLVRGRLFTADDDHRAPRTAIVNVALAAQGWPDGDPVGQELALSNGNRYTVVGVVGDTRHLALDSVPGAAIYLPHRQFPWPSMWLTVRTTGDPRQAAAAVRREVAALDARLPVARIQPLTRLVTDVAAEPRLTTLVFAIFASAALVLAAVGLYGIVSYTVVQRSRELGVRLALGAAPRRVVTLVLGQGLRLAALGVALGAAAAYGASRFLGAILYETSPLDARTYAAVAVLLLTVAALACVGPARRAARLDPVRALRTE